MKNRNELEYVVYHKSSGRLFGLFVSEGKAGILKGIVPNHRRNACERFVYGLLEQGRKVAILY